MKKMLKTALVFSSNSFIFATLLLAFVFAYKPVKAQDVSHSGIEYTWVTFRELCGSFIANPASFLDNPGSFRVGEWLWIMRAAESVGYYEFHTQGPNENPWLDGFIDTRTEGITVSCEAIAVDPRIPDIDATMQEVQRVVGQNSSLEIELGVLRPFAGPGSVNDLADYSSAMQTLRIRNVFGDANVTVHADVYEGGSVYFGVSAVYSRIR